MDSHSSNVIQFPQRPAQILSQRIEETPVVQQAIYILEQFGDELKLTQTGALPRKLVHAFWDRFFASERFAFRPYCEADCWQLARLRFLLEKSGYFSFRRGKIRRSDKADQILAERNWSELYCDLFFVMIETYEWGYDDRYSPEYDSFQYYCMDLLGRIMSCRPDSISPEQLAREEFEIQITEGVKSLDEEDSDMRKFTLEEPIHCLHLRFFDRFCVPFGLLRGTWDEEELLTPITEPYYPTDFLLNDLFPLLMRTRR